MASPIPPSSLDDSCSVIYNDSLYVYTPQAFLELPLSNGSQWSTLPSGAPTSGARCVKGAAALWVVGGTSEDPDYPGLQRFSFQNQTWATITPVTEVTKNRKSHGAAYLNASSSILVYAGSQDDPDVPSIETFVISTTAPYNVLSFTSHNLPVVSPIVISWDDSAAITLGGNSDNLNIAYFDPADPDGWSDYPTALEAGLKPVTAQQATLVTGSDGSKVLELYDLSVSPNVVSRTVLLDADGNAVDSGVTVGVANSTDSRTTRKRDLTLNDWPAYNATAAPTYTRQGFSLATSDDGLVAIAGGNEEHPVALFNQQQNAWIDSGNFFGLDDASVQSYLGPTATSSVSTPSRTPTASATSSPAAAPHHSNTSLILGATLGSILGFIALLIIFLLMLRYRRLKKRREEQNYIDEDEKRRLSFADRGDPNMMEAPAAENKHSSIAIMAGKINGGHKRGGGPQGSDSSTTHLVPPKRAQLGYHDPVEMETIVERSPHNSGRFSGVTPQAAAGEMGLKPPPQKRSSGWSRYFSGSEAGSAMPRNSGTRTPRKSNLSFKSRSSGRASSTYSVGHDCNSHGPTQIPPLNLGNEFESDRVTSILTSPSSTSPASGWLSSGPSRNTSSAGGARSRGFSAVSSKAPSTINESLFSHEPQQQSQWTPVTGSDWGSRNRDTAISSVYSEIPSRSPNPNNGASVDGTFAGAGMHQTPQYTKNAEEMSGLKMTATNMSKPPIIYSDVDHPGTGISLSGKGTDLNSLAKPAPVYPNAPQAASRLANGTLQHPGATNIGRSPSPLSNGVPQASMNDSMRSPSPSSTMLYRPPTANGPRNIQPLSAPGVSQTASSQRPNTSHSTQPSVTPSQHSSNLSDLSAFPTPGTSRPPANRPHSPTTRKPVGTNYPAVVITPSMSDAPRGNNFGAMNPTRDPRAQAGPGSNTNPFKRPMAPGFSNHDSVDSTTILGNGPFDHEKRWPPAGSVEPPRPVFTAPGRDSIDSDVILGNGAASKGQPRQENPPLAAPKFAKSDHDSIASDVTVWPMPPQTQAHRASILNDDDDSDGEGHVEIVNASRAPTAVTAIPVPASTAMQYTVRKPSKAAQGSDMSWFNMAPGTGRA